MRIRRQRILSTFLLYSIAGNTEKLSKMLKITEMHSDVMSRFHNAHYLGDVEERVRILEKSG
jgi:coatomer protein complex subunit alpha (xenin)